MGSATSRSKAASKGEPLVIKRGSSTVTVYQQTRTVSGKVYAQYVAIWFNADGKRERKAFSQAEDAKRHAEATAAALSRGDAAAVGLTGADAAVFGAACERLAEFRTSITEAVSEYTAARRKLPPGISLDDAVSDYVRRHPFSMAKRTVAQVFACFVNDRKAAGCSEVHLRDIQSRLGAFAEAFQIPIGDLTAPAVRDWLRSLKRSDGRPLTVRSLRNYHRMTASLLHFARREKFVSRELVDEIAEIELGKAAPTETGIFTVPEMAALLANCPSDLLPALAIGAFAGLRTAEIARLDWSAVDLKTGFVTLSAGVAKTAARRLVPISGNLQEWLTPFAKESGPVNPSTSDRGLNHRFVKGPAKSARVKWVRNGLRHSFCSYRLAQTSNAAQVALEAGNSPTMVFRHYRELVTPAQAEAWFAIRPGGAE